MEKSEMWSSHRQRQFMRLARLLVGLSVPLGAAAVPELHAQSTDEFDSYKIKLEGFWVYSSPSGTLHGSARTDVGAIDLQKDLGFNNYSTFAGKLDWKFTHKN